MADFPRKASFDGVTALHATAQALKCEIDGREVWVPQSQIDDDSEVWETGNHGTLVVSEWWAEQAGLI